MKESEVSREDIWRANFSEKFPDSQIVLTGKLKGSKEKSSFICGKGHSFEAIPYNMFTGASCKKCVGKYVFKDSSEWQEAFLEKHPTSDLKILGEYLKSKEKTLFGCRKGHKFFSEPTRVMQGGGCPKCSANYRYKNTQEWQSSYKSRWPLSDIVMESVYKNCSTKTLFSCDRGHLFESLPNTVMRGSGCTLCLGKYRYKDNRDWQKVFMNRFPTSQISMIGKYLNSKSMTTFKCAEGHEFLATPAGMMRGGGSCRYCVGRPKYTGREEWQNYFDLRNPESGIKMLGVYKGNKVKTKFKCKEDHVFYAKPNNVTSGHGCARCADYGFCPDKKSFFYVLGLSWNKSMLYKIGITNSVPEKRYKSKTWKRGWKVLYKEFYKNGADAMKRESGFKLDKEFLLSSKLGTVPDLGLETSGSKEVFIDHPKLEKLCFSDAV